MPHPDSAHTSLHDPVSTQISLLTNDDLATRNRSAAVRAAQFPSVEQVFDFVNRQAVAADGLRDINISVERKAQTLLVQPER
jgi:hypothetical protein